MNLTFVFETWHIPDGNYPPLHIGQLVNLSFEIGAQVLKRMWWRGSTMLHPLGEARYRFVADVVAVYGGKGSESLAVFDADGFRFYIQSDRATRGLWVRCSGWADRTVAFSDNRLCPPLPQLWLGFWLTKCRYSAFARGSRWLFAAAISPCPADCAAVPIRAWVKL